MRNYLKRLTAAFLLAMTVLACLAPVRPEAAVIRPTNLSFVRWDNTKCTAFTVKFVTTQDVDGAQFKVALTNGKTQRMTGYMDEFTEKRTEWSHTFKNLPNNHVWHVNVRTYRFSRTGKRAFSAWSNTVTVIPCPATVTSTVTNKAKGTVRLKWNPVYGCHGYSVYLTTNPAGKWYAARTTSSATATSTVISSFRGQKLRAGQNYYVRVVSRLRSNGKYVSAKLPSSRFSNGRIRISR